jgi:hypothetical protein
MYCEKILLQRFANVFFDFRESGRTGGEKSILKP